ncbi:MAG: nitronate monooxygenase [Anaerovoracaceae bacterium]|jgi:nitronate monooxygenase
MDKIYKIRELLDKIYNVTLRYEQQAAAQIDNGALSMSELRTLEAIGPRESRTMSQVSWALNIRISTLTTAINKLVKKGYVERYRIPEDRRVVMIKLTAEGNRVVQEYRKLTNGIIIEAVADMDEDEIVHFIDSAENISQFFAMQQYEPLRARENYKLSPIWLGGRELSVPLFQGGLGIGIGLGGLAGAVAACGGLGVVSATEIGYREPDYQENPDAANVRALKREYGKAREASENADRGGLVGINVTTSRPNYELMVRTAVDIGAEVIVAGGGLPMNLPKYCDNTDTALIPIVSSARAARVIKHNWKKKLNRVPAAFIFENSMAGGYLGYKIPQLDSARDEYYRTLLELREEAGEIPLIVAGGIMRRKDAVRAYAYGADGIQIGTSFITTMECDADDAFKQTYLNLKEKDVTIITNPFGKPCQVINNEFVQGLKEPLTVEEETAALIRGLNGDRRNGLFFCGGQAWRMKPANSVVDIFEEFQ